MTLHLCGGSAWEILSTRVSDVKFFPAANSARIAIRERMRWNDRMWQMAQDITVKLGLQMTLFPQHLPYRQQDLETFTSMHWRRGDRAKIGEVFPSGPWEACASDKMNVIPFLKESLQSQKLKLLFLAHNSGVSEDIELIKTAIPTATLDDVEFQLDDVERSAVEQAICSSASTFIRSPHCSVMPYGGTRFGWRIEEERLLLTKQVSFSGDTAYTHTIECCGQTVRAAALIPSSSPMYRNVDHTYASIDVCAVFLCFMHSVRPVDCKVDCRLLSSSLNILFVFH